MILRKVAPILIACSCLSPLAAAQKDLPSRLTIPHPPTVEHPQDFSEIVVPITAVKIAPSVKLGITGKLSPGFDIGANLGTGFCLDAECRFIVTNYHVAVIGRPGKVKRDKIIMRYLATGPQDEGATANSVGNGDVLPYALKRDLAMFELQRPLPHHHGLTFSLDELEVGQQVDIYGYPGGNSDLIRPRELTRFPAVFKAPTTSGLLAFDYTGKVMQPGVSGGIVVDRKTQKIVGVLNSMARNGEAVAVAVPVQYLADFVSREQPWLARSIFPPTKGSIPPASVDLYPKFLEPPTDSLQHRPDEPAAVKVLREKAQLLADNIRNFVAVQTFAFGSGENNVPRVVAAYEVQVIDGYQRFREYPDGKKEFQDLPLPALNTVVGTGGEWSELPQMVGKTPRFKIHQFPDTVVNGRRIKVFQYHAEVEDGVCVFKSITDFVFFSTSKYLTAPCYGEVWTDEDSNILRVSEHYEAVIDKWKDFQGVVTYGRLKLPDESTRLVPLTIATQAEHKKKVYWCRGAFTDYRVFDSQVKIIANDYVQSLPK